MNEAEDLAVPCRQRLLVMGRRRAWAIGTRIFAHDIMIRWPVANQTLFYTPQCLDQTSGTYRTARKGAETSGGSYKYEKALYPLPPSASTPLSSDFTLGGSTMIVYQDRLSGSSLHPCVFSLQFSRPLIEEIELHLISFLNLLAILILFLKKRAVCYSSLVTLLLSNRKLGIHSIIGRAPCGFGLGIAVERWIWLNLLCLCVAGNELLSDSFLYRELENGVLWEVDGQVSVLLSSCCVCCALLY